MKRYILCTILLSAVSASAATLDSAINEAFHNNNSIISQEYTVQSAKHQAQAQKSGYFPKADVGYAYKHSSEKAFGYVEEQFSQAGLEVSYNLFNGGADKYGYLAAEKQYEAQQFSGEAIRQDVILSVKKAYIEILKAKENIAVADRAVALLENQLNDVKLSYSVGYVAKNEVLKVEAELASAKQTQLSAVSVYKTSVFSLEQLTGTNYSDDEVFQTFQLPEDTADYNELKKAMFANRSEIKYTQSLIESADYSKKAVKAGYLPKVNVGAGLYSYGQDLSPAERDYTYDSETLLSASVNLNLFDGFTRKNSIMAQETAKKALAYGLFDLKSQMDLQLKTALENLKLAKVSLETANSEHESAAENYRITQNRFKQKVATNTDLLDARVMLTRAESSRNTARFNIYKAIAEIERITEKKGLKYGND
ncbi:TolC family protein [Seleniivibrio woodruffii]|uniref:TolC family protein n=1 Tax=Seleniivibrio woodruffii TaxID=1078050 RepID=UPI0026EEE6EE|nr:TolC family protein [Seleniivibrio woodruffii]